jgi:hypothetical protein
MITRQLALAACAIMVLSAGSAYAGPCNTRDKDAGSGPTPGATASITTGSAETNPSARLSIPLPVLERSLMAAALQVVEKVASDF